MLDECLATLSRVVTDDNPAIFLHTSEDLAGLYLIWEWSTLDNFENQTQIENLSINTVEKKDFLNQPTRKVEQVNLTL